MWLPKAVGSACSTTAAAISPDGDPRSWPTVLILSLDPATHHSYFPIPKGSGGGPVLWEFEPTS
jgi:hypothetical protein